MMHQLVIDQMGREVEVPLAPQRIISLVPSQTELLLDLGLGERLVGRTKFCIHPVDVVRNIAIIGGTKKLNMDRIHELQPDLIIGNKEENKEGQIIELSAKYPVWMSDIYDLSDALEMIRDLGSLLAVEAQADAMAAEISDGFEGLGKMISGSVVYLIWDKPIMAVGPNTFINDMIRGLGLSNAVTKNRYPDLSISSLQDLNPDFLFLSSEPFPYKDKHIKTYQKLLPTTKVILVDGEMFSWYGSRLLKSVDYFRELRNTLT
ncbi:MAG: helical backbone metal receptor [Cyclobacteriaceae bacterium]